MAFVTFNTKEHPLFDELKTRVDAYFNQTGKNRWGNWKIYLKSGILLTALAGFYTWLVFFTPGVLLSILLCALLGLTLAAVGFNVMHDSAHGSFSKYNWVNNMMSYSLNLMGGDVHLWKTKHNMVHHSFTNIQGMDDDIDILPVMRLNLHQKRYWMHRFQHIYGFIFYALNYLFWVFYFDYKKYFSGKIGVTKIRKYGFWDHVSFWATKAVYLFVFIALPMMVVGVMSTIIGYIILTCVCGTMIAVVFQLAHIVEETHFHDPAGQHQKLETEWAVHQIQTSSNFATHNKFVHWFTGGLNHQVEHHLFPRISHIHYPALATIVRETCMKFGITYNEHRTVLLAVRSHVVHLRSIGRHN
ncbi:MAG: acyl-CoA desaturase [Flavobacteriales bacterium]|nr:acyl-CoA desaturase [Flavobacteriales bacterium]